MKNDNQEDRIEMAQEIAEVRKTGLANMMDRIEVANILCTLGHDYTAEYVVDNIGDYMDLLVMSGEY